MAAGLHLIRLGHAFKTRMSSDYDQSAINGQHSRPSKSREPPQGMPAFS
jgi:hypothetical protein